MTTRRGFLIRTLTASAAAALPTGHVARALAAEAEPEPFEVAPGVRYSAGHQTNTPYTLSNRCVAMRSFATLFCAQNTGSVRGASASHHLQRPVEAHRTAEELAREIAAVADDDLDSVLDRLRSDAIARAGSELRDDMVLLGLRPTGSREPAATA